MDTKGLVFGIQHFSIHDGDGIRSNVFLKDVLFVVFGVTTQKG